MPQLDDLNQGLTALGTDINAEVAKVTSLEEQLTTLQNNTPPTVDLSGAIATVQALRASLGDIATAAATVASTTTPADQTQTTGADAGAATAQPASTSGADAGTAAAAPAAPADGSQTTDVQPAA